LKQLIDSDTDIFKTKNLYHMVELNFRVLTGKTITRAISTGASSRRRTTDSPERIPTILRWCKRHDEDTSWKQAAGVYVECLTPPQLFTEGNHRTSSIIASSILVRDGHPPFVLTPENAVAYFGPSSVMKFETNKKSMMDRWLRIPGLKKAFAKFLRSTSDVAYLLSG